MHERQAPAVESGAFFVSKIIFLFFYFFFFLVNRLIRSISVNQIMYTMHRTNMDEMHSQCGQDAQHRCTPCTTILIYKDL